MAKKDKSLVKLVDDIARTVADMNEPFVSKGNQEHNQEKLNDQVGRLVMLVTGHGTGDD